MFQPLVFDSGKLSVDESFSGDVELDTINDLMDNGGVNAISTTHTFLRIFAL